MKKILPIILIVLVVLAALVFFQRQRILGDLESVGQGKTYQGVFYTLKIPPFPLKPEGFLKVTVPIDQAFLEPEPLAISLGLSKIEINGLRLSQGLWFGQKRELTFPKSIQTPEGMTLEGMRLALGKGERIASWQFKRLSFEPKASSQPTIPDGGEKPPLKLVLEGFSSEAREVEGNYPTNYFAKVEKLNFYSKGQSAEGLKVNSLSLHYQWNKDASGPEGPTPELTEEVQFESAHFKENSEHFEAKGFQITYQVLYEPEDSPEKAFKEFFNKLDARQMARTKQASFAWIRQYLSDGLRPNQLKGSLASLQHTQGEEKRFLGEGIQFHLNSEGDESQVKLDFKLSTFPTDPKQLKLSQAPFSYKQNSRLPWIALTNLLQDQKTGAYQVGVDPLEGQKVFYQMQASGDLGAEYFAPELLFKLEMPLDGLLVGLPKLPVTQADSWEALGEEFNQWSAGLGERLRQKFLESALFNVEIEIGRYSSFQKFIAEQTGAPSALALAVAAPYMVIDSAADQVKSELKLEKGKIYVNGQPNPALQSFFDEILKRGI